MTSIPLRFRARREYNVNQSLENESRAGGGKTARKGVVPFKGQDRRYLSCEPSVSLRCGDWFVKGGKSADVLIPRAHVNVSYWQASWRLRDLLLAVLANGLPSIFNRQGQPLNELRQGHAAVRNPRLCSKRRDRKSAQ